MLFGSIHSFDCFGDVNFHVHDDRWCKIISTLLRSKGELMLYPRIVVRVCVSCGINVFVCVCDQVNQC